MVVRLWEEKEGEGVQSDLMSSPPSGQGEKGEPHDRNTGEG
jgi:hypothetical protein